MTGLRSISASAALPRVTCLSEKPIRADSKGLELIFEGGAALPRHVNGDQGKLNQVLINLLDNAIKFTAAGQVRLLTAWKDGRALFSVADTGPGISLDDQVRLFGAFVQIPTGRDAQEGTGLGLAISRAFARLMGGDITVTSEPGKDSTFTCTLMLPLSESAAAVTPATVRTVVGLAPGQRPLRVLVADDVADNRKPLVGIQATLGFSILVWCPTITLNYFRVFRPECCVARRRHSPAMTFGPGPQQVADVQAGARHAAQAAGFHPPRALPRAEIHRKFLQVTSGTPH